MIIETKKKAIKTRLRAFITAIIYTTIMIVIILSGLFDGPLLGMNKYHYAIIVTTIYLLISVYYYALNVNYIYFTTENDKIIIRYYSLRPFSSKKNSIEIPVNELYRFEIKDSLLGAKKNLVLYRKMKRGIAKYPLISLSALGREELDIIRKTLFHYVMKK